MPMKYQLNTKISSIISIPTKHSSYFIILYNIPLLPISINRHAKYFFSFFLPIYKSPPPPISFTLFLSQFLHSPPFSSSSSFPFSFSSYFFSLLFSFFFYFWFCNLFLSFLICKTLKKMNNQRFHQNLIEYGNRYIMQNYEVQEELCLN